MLTLMIVAAAVLLASLIAFTFAVGADKEDFAAPAGIIGVLSVVGFMVLTIIHVAQQS